MKFLSIYKSTERSTPPSQEEMAKMGRLIEGCLPSALGARVRLSDGKLNVSDCPFTESKEVVGGLAILQANSKEEALEYVKQFLEVVGGGECELRQLFEAGHNTCAEKAAHS